MQPTSSRAFRRDSQDRVVLGLCAGLARALDLPVGAVRLAVFVALLLSPGLVIIGYAGGALIVPRDDGRALLGGVPAGGRDSVIGWGLAGFAALLLLDRWVDPVFALRSVATDPFTVVRWVGVENVRLLLSGPILLFALGIGVWIATRRPAAAMPDQGARPLDSPATAMPDQGARPLDPVDTAVAPTVVLPPPPPAGRSIAPYGVAGVVIAFAAVAGLIAAGAFTITTTAVAGLLAGAAVVLAVAAIAFAGNRGTPALLGLAILLGGATLAVAALPTEFRGEIGSRTVRPLSLDDLQGSYRRGIGDLDIDLTALDLPKGDTRLVAEVGLGNLVVHVPDGVRVRSVGPTFVNTGFGGAGPAKGKPPTLLIQAYTHHGDAVVIRDGP